MDHMTEPSNPPASQSLEANDSEINLFDILIALAKHKKVILGLPLVVAMVAAGYSFTLPIVYSANTVILPPQQSQSATATVLAQLGGGIAGMVGGVAKNPNDIYVTMLKSRAVADKIIQRFGLMTLWDIDMKHPSDAYSALAGVAKIATEKDGTITIEVEDTDPKRAADVANAYVEELLKLTSLVAVTEASKRRLFFERQLAQAKDNLTKAEASARQALQQGGLVDADAQGRALLVTTASLRGQITVKEIQIGAMRTFAADRNPDLRLAQQELEMLRRELAKLEGARGVTAAINGQSDQGTESLRLLRDVKYQEVIFELLAKQYELAKIDEAKESTIIQVVDKAVLPDRKSKPKRRNIVVLWTLMAGFFALLWVFLHEVIARARENPDQLRQMQMFRGYLVGK